MKRSTWLESLASAVGSDRTLTPGIREELSQIDAILFDAWNLGENIMLAWTRDRSGLRFLAVRHYKILEPFGEHRAGPEEPQGPHDFITRILAGPKFLRPVQFDALRQSLGRAARLISASVSSDHELNADFVSALVTRYGVTLVRERAVLLLDVVGFSLRPPLEQVAMLNSLSYSVNSAYSQLASEDIQLNFARSTTGDGFYIWNRARTVDANIALFKLMMLILADNAVAKRKARSFPVPRIRAAFHVGEHFEFYQVEALNPTTFGYIVGQVTIDLARILEKALPGQILLGEFDIAMTDAQTGGVVSYNTLDFVDRTAEVLDRLEGLAVAGDHVGEVHCYLTGGQATGGGHSVERHSVRDKHGMTRPVYNAKINIHLREGRPIFLGIQHADLNRPDAPWPG